jgi:surface polysaccharide O-acyltransferase-like enzyme
MIVAMHAPIPGLDWNGIVLAADSFLTAPGIGIFIMVSGALLLPVTISTKEFLKRRLSKVVIPTFVWTILYYLVAPWTETVGRGDGMQSFFSIPFSAQYNGALVSLNIC